MPITLSIALCLRDDERQLPDMARGAVDLARRLATEQAAGEWVAQAAESPLEFEILALDEASRDNTASVLSILHAKVPELMTISDLQRGTAIMRAARTARGRAWLIVDGPFDFDHGLWALRQILRGDRAAMVPGEVLAVERNLGQAALGWLRGGLASAQREVEGMLASQGQRSAWSPPYRAGVRERAELFLRGRLAPLGLAHLDRRW